MLKCAVIGLGNIGLKCETDPFRLKPASHCGAFLTHPDTDLSMMMDINEAHTDYARKKFPEIKCSNNIQDVIKGKFDIVSVATSPESHCTIVNALAGHCGLIICEKPIALSADDATRMVEVCDKTHTKLLINHHRRFDDLIMNLKATLSESIGNVTNAACFYTNGLFTNGSHIVDLLLFMFGKPNHLMARKVDRSCQPGDFNADVLFSFESANASMQALELSNMNIFDIHFFGEKGVAKLTQFSRRLEITPKRNCTLFSGYYEPDYDFKEVSFSSVSSMYSTINHAVKCFNGERILCTGRDAIDGLGIIKEIEMNLKVV